MKPSLRKSSLVKEETPDMPVLRRQLELNKNTTNPAQAGTECPLCGKSIENNLGAHIRKVHGEEKLRQVVLAAKEQGMPDAEIGARYGVSFNYLQQIITEAYGANISVLKRPKRIKRWQPKDFREETTTVWSFEQRGSWATSPLAFWQWL